MRVVFFGTPEFAVPSLAALLAAGIDVAAVVTQPDRPRGHHHSVLVPSPVKARAVAAGIPVWQPERPRGEAFLRQLQDAHADIGVIVAYGHLLPAALLAIPRHGFVNVHASLLPRWRGAAPVEWALLSGDAETGVAIMRVEEGLDTGAIWCQRRTVITDDDTAGTLAERLSQLGAGALLEALPGIAGGGAPVPQRAGEATHAPKILRETARIRWAEPTRAVSCRIRAMDPARGAWTTITGAEIKLYAPRIAPSVSTPTDDEPGTLVETAERVLVATGDGAVEVGLVQLAGRRRISAVDWARGAHLAAGAHFE